MDEIIYGKNTVGEYIKNKAVEKIWLSKNFTDPKVMSLIKNQEQTYVFVTNQKLNALTMNANHQGIVAKISAYNYWSLDEMIQNSKKENPRIIILDGLEDPHNLGSIIRTAECLGVAGIIIPKNRSVQVNNTVIKVASGATNYLPIVKVTNLTKTIQKLKEKYNFWTVAFDVSGESDFNKIHKDVPLAIIMGNENQGITQSILKASDHVVSIKMLGKTESLNVSVAAGIAINNLQER